jgi:hypothetical protein
MGMRLLRSRPARIAVAALMVLVLVALVLPFQALIFGSRERTMASAGDLFERGALGQWLTPSGQGQIVLRSAHSLCTSSGSPAGQWWILQVGVLVPGEPAAVAEALRRQFDVVQARGTDEWLLQESRSGPAGWTGMVRPDAAGTVIALSTQVRRTEKDDPAGWALTCETVST